MISLSASRLQLARRCLAPFRTLEFDPPPPGPAAERGTRLHAELAAAEPERHGPNVHVEVSFGWRRDGTVALLGYDLARDYPSDWDIIGTADRVELTEDAVIITDHKSGQRLPYAARDSWQLGFLAMCAAQHFGRDSATVTLNYLDQGERDTAELTTLELRTFAADLLAATAPSAPAQPRPGSHCHDLYCPARAVCPAIHAQAAAIIPVPSLLSRERGGEALEALRAAKHLCEEFEVQLKRLADETGGIPTVKGKVWKGVPSSRESIGVKEARATFGDAVEPLVKRSEFLTYREVKA